jgi:hypothetical protein
MSLHPIFAQALAPFAPPQSAVHQSINDDDWYVIDAATSKVIRRVSCKNQRPEPSHGQYVERGISAKYIPGLSL